MSNINASNSCATPKHRILSKRAFILTLRQTISTLFDCFSISRIILKKK